MYTHLISSLTSTHCPCPYIAVNLTLPVKLRFSLFSFGGRKAYQMLCRWYFSRLLCKRKICSLSHVDSSFSDHSGSAQQVAVRSALVLTNASWLGCHRHWMTLSLCSATTTLGRGRSRSPDGEKRLVECASHCAVKTLSRVELWELVWHLREIVSAK